MYTCEPLAPLWVARRCNLRESVPGAATSDKSSEPGAASVLHPSVPTELPAERALPPTPTQSRCLVSSTVSRVALYGSKYTTLALLLIMVFILVYNFGYQPSCETKPMCGREQVPNEAVTRATFRHHTLALSPTSMFSCICTLYYAGMCPHSC